MRQYKIAVKLNYTFPMDLPYFKYDPDPIATGSIVPSGEVCPVCSRLRAFEYQGSLYCTQDLEHVCPWCIADGSAHNNFDAEFTGLEEVGGFYNWEEVSKEIIEEIAFRTPGFSTWQGEHWFTHCGDAGEFIGPMGKEELQQTGPEAIEVIQRESGHQGPDWDHHFPALERDHTATAYLFKCRHCGQLGGFSDCH